MVDFLLISTRPTKKGVTEIYPKFIIKRSEDLMIRGGDFYAIWLEERQLWSTDEQDALRLIDRELDIFAEEQKAKIDGPVRVMHMWDAESGMIDVWHKYCQKQLRDNFHMLDEKLIFSNTETKKTDYASKRLPYPLTEGSTEAWDRMMSVLYSEEERRKIEWAIGSIVSGDSKHIQKFLVLYGAAGTGKSTVLNVIQQLFQGYYSVFDAKALGSSNNAFALEAFRTNPLVAIQHDGDLSKIEDNTRLNSLVSHELMTVNEKYAKSYANNFKCFLFMGTNKPVKITDAKSGLIRRLIDVTPTGNKVGAAEYKRLVKQITFELGAIAQHCLDIYQDQPDRYDNYIPLNMLGASNDFYNFILDAYTVFCDADQTTLKAAWQMYNTYCDDAKVSYPFSQRIFKEELRNYFAEFKDRATLDDGTRVRNLYSGFLKDKFLTPEGVEEKDTPPLWIDLKERKSVLDDILADCPAQYATEQGKPLQKWAEVTTKLIDISTDRIHYVKPPKNHIVIDFDIPGEDGSKSLERNLEEAAKWKPTYAELSKSGAGIHLHYIYEGDASKLSRIFADHIEVKVFTGNSSLRRKLTKCNDISVATINTGLPLKGEKMVNFEGVKNEKAMRALIKKNLRKEVHGATKPSVDFIYEILEQAYKKKEFAYDVTDMRKAIFAFAANSTNQAEYCMKLVSKMHFKSEEPSETPDGGEGPLIFYDVEVFPNLFLVNWKKQGKDQTVVRMINPTPQQIEELLRFRLVGFNCRRYDNHMLYARLIGENNEKLFQRSQRMIVEKDKDAFFGEAYDISYTDVYDFCNEKQSLKKWEIELGIHHKELGLPWDEPVPEELWPKVAEYCDYDVIATEAVFDARQADFTARKLLASIAGMNVNTTTNSLSARIIFGKEKNPQKEFNYRDLSGGTGKKDPIPAAETVYENYTVFDEYGRPIFPGYSFENGVSTYRGVEVGEGGRVFAVPGIYILVALLDIASMHPRSAIAEELFGKYTRRFAEIVEARIQIKHKNWSEAEKLLDGNLKPYIQMILNGEIEADDLAFALKIVVNSVYGLTAANFDNPFHDIRNKDNIVAKRGALFMINLEHEVKARGFTVAHIKTDSIKIPNATPEIIQFVMEYGKKYGYTFEHEATYEKMCLVNDAVYVAKYASNEQCMQLYGYLPTKQKEGKWTATGTQFQVPYVFKTLFSKEPIIFEDMCETKSVSTALYLDMNEGMPDVSREESELKKIEKFYRDKLPDELVGVDQELYARYETLFKTVEAAHNYIFVGKVGQFCPMKPGTGGGLLMRQTEDKNTGEKKYAAATGTKGFRWMESEMVKNLEKEDDIDRSYYEKLVDDAVDAISKYGDFEWFVDETPHNPVPPWEEADDPWNDDDMFKKR